MSLSRHTSTAPLRWVYPFLNHLLSAPDKALDLLGSKGLSLSRMTQLGLPVPPGFIVSTEACAEFFRGDGQLSKALKNEILLALKALEEETGLQFGSGSLPLLVSVRSGAAPSMPGMMDTVLNVGLNDLTVEALATRTQNKRFAYDSYRRLLAMYAEVVMGIKKEHMDQLLERMKEKMGVHSEASLGAEALQALCDILKSRIFELSGHPFPQDPHEQLWQALEAVFKSWNNHRAVHFRNAMHLSHDLYTAATIQSMVFGNMGASSATGVAFSRDPNSGERHMFGEWLPNAQGEDVVAGFGMPQGLNAFSSAFLDEQTLEELMPEVYQELLETCELLEAHYKDLQDIEFTIQEGKLWVLQTRTGQRAPEAEIKIAVSMVKEGLIKPKDAILRVRSNTLERLIYPHIDPEAKPHKLAQGLPASPGAASGFLSFSPQNALERAKKGEPILLVRKETSPDDIHAMLRIRGVLTVRGGMTSHAAVVARGMSKPCVVGCRAMTIDSEKKTLNLDGRSFSEGDMLTIDGSTGWVMEGRVPTVFPEPSKELQELMSWVDQQRKIKVYANADTVSECEAALTLGADGVGLCRTEHMFFENQRDHVLQRMILASQEDERRQVLQELFPMQRNDFLDIFRCMEGKPVMIRLLDRPINAFLPQTQKDMENIALHTGKSTAELKAAYDALREANPLFGRRGIRLGMTFPEVYEMQVKAITHAARQLLLEGMPVNVSIMLPFVSSAREFDLMQMLIKTTIASCDQAPSLGLNFPIGTMIELPRACLRADRIAEKADFFSFGTNDLTQSCFGISRDDAPSFLPLYLDTGVISEDPFVSLDPAVEALIEIAIKKGSSVRPQLELGLCGDQASTPESIMFCHQSGIDHVSCTPFSLPVARLAAAKVALEDL